MKHVLVVTAYFPPAAFIGSQRPLKLVRDIGSFGWRASVLTVATRCSGPIDQQSASRIPNDVEVVRTPCWSLWNHSLWWQSARGRFRRAAAMANRLVAKCTWNLLPTDQHWPWSVAAVKAGVEMVRRNKSDAIWATSPSLSALLLAHRISQKTHVPFVTDFRDVRSAPQHDTPRYERMSFRKESQILRNASAVTYVAPEQLSVLRHKHPKAMLRLPSELIYNWFDVNECDDASPYCFENPTILHGGILYGGTRRLDGFMQALAIVNANLLTGASRPRFLQLGGMPSDGDYVLTLARRFEVTSAVDVQDAVPHDQFARMCRGARALLLVVGHDQGVHRHSGAIPGKLYSYFAAQRPILVIGPKGCEAGMMVRKLNRGVFALDDDPEQIASGITQVLGMKESADPFDLSLEALAPYSADAALGRLTDLLNRMALSAGDNRPSSQLVSDT